MSHMDNLSKNDKITTLKDSLKKLSHNQIDLSNINNEKLLTSYEDIFKVKKEDFQKNKKKYFQTLYDLVNLIIYPFELKKTYASNWELLVFCFFHFKNKGEINVFSGITKLSFISSQYKDIGYVYFIKFVETDFVKVGMSQKNNYDRINDYTNPTDFVLIKPTTCPTAMENLILKRFKELAGNPIKGNEYFKGNTDILLIEFLKIVNDNKPKFDQKEIFMKKPLDPTFSKEHMAKFEPKKYKKAHPKNITWYFSV